MNQYIPESELIITTKGTIYHLDLAPEHITPTIITVGDPGRVKDVSKHFDEITHKAEHREFISHIGRIGNKPISVISTGIGPDNIDIVFNELDALANIDFNSRAIKQEKKQLQIIRLGTCGGLQADIQVDSLVVSTHGIGLDNLMHYYNFHNTDEEQTLLEKFCLHTDLKDSPIKPYIFKGSTPLAAAFTTGFNKGITVTCPGFYGPQGRKLRLPLAFPALIDLLPTFEHENLKINNFEMETSAMYGLASMMGHKCLSVSVIVANRMAKTFSKDGNKAVENMIVKSLGIIEDIL